jgi:phosphoribosylformylglycinamidine (FGAM) synthase-like amidotransferase family enzyme
MKAAVVVFPGSNRERDVCLALERASGEKPHVVWHRDTELPKADLIVIPGGFAYGDYLRCGAMAAHSPIMREVKARRPGRPSRRQLLRRARAARPARG